jgi:Zn-finger nucleic acid-binding protein
MTLIVECPNCGAYVVERDGQDDEHVEHEVCRPCRKVTSDGLSFDEGFARYEESQRIDGEEPPAGERWATPAELARAALAASPSPPDGACLQRKEER